MTKDEQLDPDLGAAVVLGSKACIYMAQQIQNLYVDWIIIAKAMRTNDEMLTLLESVDMTMQSLGDMLNGMDAVEAEDERKTKRAYKEVAKAMRKHKAACGPSP